MPYLGSWKIDDALTFPAITHRFDTGALTDADAVPAYRVYEDETSTAILTGNMAKLDDANTTGFYTEAITLSAANGFEKGKCYTIYITATVNSVTGGSFHTFQIEAEVDANVVSDKTGYTASTVSDKTGYSLANGAITAAVIATDAIDADALAADAIAEINATVDTALADYDAPTKAELDAAVANVSVDEIQATALADLFNTDSGTTYASAVAGSVVKEIADNAGGSSLTAADIADAVWDEAQADHVSAGSFGEMATETAAILVDTAEIGAAGAGLTNINLPDQTMNITGNITGNLSGSVGSVTAEVTANVKKINDVTITGDGSGTPFNVA